MAQAYLKAPPRSPLRTPPTNAQLLRAIATQLEGIANTLQSIVYALPTNNQVADWEIRERLGLPHSRGGLQCPPPPKMM